MITKQNLIDMIEASYAKDGRGCSIGHSEGYRQCADLDGTFARQYLESLGFEVVDNGDNGRNGYAITACGLYLSTNGYIHKV